MSEGDSYFHFHISPFPSYPNVPSHPTDQPPNSTMPPKSPFISFSPIQTIEIVPQTAANVHTNKGPAPQLAMPSLEDSAGSTASSVDSSDPRTDVSHLPPAPRKTSDAVTITNPLLPDFVAHSAHDFMYAYLSQSRQVPQRIPIAASTFRNATQSPLLRLPADIRHRIWSYILQRPGCTHLGNDKNRDLKVQSLKIKNIMRMGTTCRLMRAELNLAFLSQQTIEFRRRFFKKWMANFTADQHQAIRKVRIYESETRQGMEGFWNNVAKLGALEKFVLIVDAHEGMAKARNRVMGFFSNKLNCVIGHKVEFEVLERVHDHNKPRGQQIALVI